MEAFILETREKEDTQSRKNLHLLNQELNFMKFRTKGKLRHLPSSPMHFLISAP